MSTQKWQPPKAVIEHRELASKWGRQTHVPAALILAVIQQESGGRAAAVRAEAGYLKQYGATPKFVQIVKATRLMPEQVAASYGLMQLMLPLAWGYMSEGDKGSNAIVALLDPEKNVRYGSAHSAVLLKQVCNCMKRNIDEDVVRAVAARYNGCNLYDDYADNVVALWRRYDKWLRGVK